MDNKRILTLLALLGAFIAIVSIFLSWVEMTAGVTKTFTGLDIMTGNNIDADNGFLVTLAFTFALIALVCVLFDFLGMVPERVSTYTSILLPILGVLVICMAVTFWLTEINKETFIVELSAGVGLWLAVAGGALIAAPKLLDYVDLI